MTERYGDLANGFRGVEYVLLRHTTDESLLHVSRLSDVTRLCCGEDGNHGILSSRGIDSLKRLQHLEEITFSGSRFTDDLLAEFFASQAKLRSVRLWGTQAGRQTLHALARIQSIEELDLSGTSLVDEDFQGLDPLLKLENVSISNREFSVSGAEWLSQSIRLRVLRLSETEVTDLALAQLSILPALEVLWIQDSSKVTELGIEHITALSGLKSLWLPAHVVTYHTVDLLRQMPSLVEVMTSGSIVDQDLRSYFYRSWRPRTSITAGTP